MSTGENITNAVKVIETTYQNISKFFKDLDEVVNVAGYVSITPRFLRYKSDNDITGWMISGFIKLFQHKECNVIPECGGLLDGPIYGIDVTLHDPEYLYPTLTAVKYIYEAGALVDWQKLPAVNDHWGFYYPTRNKEYMNFETLGNGLTRAKLQPNKPASTYWGLEEAIFSRMELVTISSKEKIQNEVIPVFETLRRFQRMP